MTKDRLAELHAARSDDEEVIQDYVAVTVEERDHYLDEFFNQVNEIREMIRKVQDNVEKQTAIVSVPQSGEKTKQELADIKKNAKRVIGKLKGIKKNIEQEEQLNKTSAKFRIREFQHSTMSTKFEKVMDDYYCIIEKDYSESCKGRTPQLDEERENMLEQDNPAEVRRDDLIKLETSIMEMHDLIMDLALQLESQSDMIDHIEYNVEHAMEYVQTATQHIKKALKNQSNVRRKKITILICLAVLGIIAATFVSSYFIMKR